MFKEFAYFSAAFLDDIVLEIYIWQVW